MHVKQQTMNLLSNFLAISARIHRYVVSFLALTMGSLPHLGNLESFSKGASSLSEYPKKNKLCFSRFLSDIGAR